MAGQWWAYWPNDGQLLTGTYRVLTLCLTVCLWLCTLCQSYQLRRALPVDIWSRSLWRNCTNHKYSRVCDQNPVQGGQLEAVVSWGYPKRRLGKGLFPCFGLSTVAA